MKIEEIRTLINSEMEAVDELIRHRLQSDVALINQLGHYIIGSGGKRLRPVLLLLSAGAFGHKSSKAPLLAAIIEFIHTATLLHDDVVDASDMRRGQDTANAIWGNEASVLVGDFLYSRSFEMMIEIGDMRIMEILAHATNTIAEGEVLQLLNCHEPDTTEEQYMEVIQCKTAKLFEAATQLGAILGEGSPEQEEAMAHYGMHLGTAFQLIDDVLDYSATAEEIGKNIGDDLAEGKPTLPLIYTMREGNKAQADIVSNAIRTGGRNDMAAVSAAIESTGAITYTAKRAEKEAELAKKAASCLDSSPYKNALLALADFSVNRTH